MYRILSVAVLALALSGCNNAHTLGGALLGGAGGAFGGSKIGQGKGKLAATAGGALLGAGLGGYFGNFFDQIGNNANSIGQLQQNQSQRSAGAAGPTIYNFPSGSGGPTPYYQGGHPNAQLPLNCHVRNNYVICGSQ